jgi:transposase-like protein
LFAEPHFQNDEAARAMLESILWPEGPVCPHCGVVNHAYKIKRPGVFRCAEKGCRKDFSVTMKTVMERSHIALHRWLKAFPDGVQQEGRFGPSTAPYPTDRLRSRVVHGSPYP